MDELIQKAKDHLLTYGLKGFANHSTMPVLMVEFHKTNLKPLMINLLNSMSSNDFDNGDFQDLVSEFLSKQR